MILLAHEIYQSAQTLLEAAGTETPGMHRQLPLHPLEGEDV